VESGGGAAARVWREAVAMTRTVLAHDLPKLAATLTYFTVLSLLPALIVVVAFLGLVGLSPDALQSLLDAAGKLGAPWAAEFVSGALDSVLGAQSSGLVLVVGLVAALWAASAYVGAFMWASDRIYRVETPRPFWRGLPLRLALALLLLTLLTVTAAVMGLVGPVGRWVADASGIGTGPLQLWSWIKWPLLLGLGLLLLIVLYRLAPARRQPALWRLLAGAGAAIGLWIAASAGFSVYVDHVASYNRVYGTLGAAVAFLVWAWVVNIALLLGVEVNREIEERGGAREAERSGV
jgi:membrane protein